MNRTNPVFRVLAIVLILASLGMVFLPWATVSYMGVSESISYFEFIKAGVEEMGESGLDAFTNTTEGTLFLIATLLFLITAIASIVLAACGLRWGGIPFFVGSLLSLSFFIYYVVTMNKEAYDYYGMNLVHIGIGAILCAVFALIAMVLLFIPDNGGSFGGGRTSYGGGYGGGSRGGYGGGAPARPASATWTCPNCGTILADRERFCPNCGGSRAPTTPAALRCAGCGAVLEKSSGFCPNCGTPIGAPLPKTPTYTPPVTPTYTPPVTPAKPAAPPSTGGFHAAGDDDL